MSASIVQVDASLGAAFPQQSDARWEAENRATWNEQERMNEERELVYEISWIPEINAWRRFLRPGRRSAKVQ